MEFLFVFLIAIFASLLNILHVLLRAFKTPAGQLYLWTGHYFQDYFVYLQAMVQGARGRWLVENPFATDDYTQTFLDYEPDLLMGKIGGLFHLPPMVTYWFFVALFSFFLALLLFLTLSFLLPKKPFYLQFSAFLLTLFATPFFKIKEGKIVPIETWYGPTPFFERFSSVPRHILEQIIGLIIILLLARILVKIKKYSLKEIVLRVLVTGLLISLLLTFSFLTINLLGTIFLVGLYLMAKSLLLKKKEFWRYFLLFGFLAVLIFPAVLGVKLFQTQSGVVLRSQDYGLLQQVKLSPSFLLLLFGPLIIFSPFGLTSFFRFLSPLRMVIFFLFIVSLIFFYSPLGSFLGDTNMRFLTPLMFIFLGVSAILGTEQLASFLKPVLRKGFVIAITGFLLLYFSLPNVIFFYHHRLNNLSLTSIGSIPQDFVQGFAFLDSIPDKDAVLTGTNSLLGSFLPIFADKRVYLGSLIFTPMYERKAVLVSLFYKGEMTPRIAQEFLEKNKIKFVVWSSWDGAIAPLTRYDFLRPIFKNGSMIIFKYQEK